MKFFWVLIFLLVQSFICVAQDKNNLNQTGCICTTDSNGDGVMDGIGKCPCNCPRNFVGIDDGVQIENTYISFNNNAVLYDWAKLKLDNVAEQMRNNLSFKVVVEITCTNENNLKLNTKRAKAIIDYLIKDLGVDRDRFIFLKKNAVNTNINTVIIRKPKENEMGSTIKE